LLNFTANNIQIYALERLKYFISISIFQITDVGFCHSTNNIKNLTRLSHLELSNCPRLNNKCLKTIALPLFRSVRLIGTSKITLEGVKTMISQNPALEKLAVVGVLPTNLCEIGEKFARANMKRMKWVKFAVEK
jgi:hypothetical protein